MTHDETPDGRRESPLNRELILDGAIDLIEREGPDALSMRRLGKSLGVEGMAIYHHFDGRDELLAALAERLLDVLNDVELADDWRAACERFASALRQIAVVRPASFQLVGMQPLIGQRELEPVERLLEILVDAGFPPRTALAVYRAIVSYARGYALAEAGGFTVDAAGAGGRVLKGLPRGRFPILAGRAAELTDLDPDDAFALGLHALLAGLADPTEDGR